MKNTSTHFLLGQLDAIRGNDNYPDQETKENLLSTFFPSATSDLVADLSNVTSAFYGFLLKSIGDKYGNEQINQHSEQLFYNLGQIKTEQALVKNSNLYRDCRAFAVVGISAIYNASPEYVFTVEQFLPEYTELKLTGVDRYYRIAKQLGIEKYLNFPTLLPFMRGIKDVLQLEDTSIEITTTSFDDDYKTECTYIFKQNHL